ncbi:MAG: hypothetical protein JSR45_02655 [Proteobacteria bacterium]|nr:hypothetical protein [Pseudomonadota bacterium]
MAWLFFAAALVLGGFAGFSLLSNVAALKNGCVFLAFRPVRREAAPKTYWAGVALQTGRTAFLGLASALLLASGVGALA